MMQYEEFSPVRGTTLDELKELVLSMKTTTEKALGDLQGQIEQSFEYSKYLGEQIDELREESKNSTVYLETLINDNEKKVFMIADRLDIRIDELSAEFLEATNKLKFDVGDIGRDVNDLRTSTGSDKNDEPKKSEKSIRKKVKIGDQGTKAESRKTRSIFSRKSTQDLNKEEEDNLNTEPKDKVEEDSDNDEIDLKGVKYRKVTSSKSPPKVTDSKQKSSTSSGSTSPKNTKSTTASTTAGSGGDPGDGSESSDSSTSSDDNRGSNNPRGNNRRLTITPRVPVDLVNGGAENSVSVMVHPYRVDEKDKIRVITLKSMKRLAEIYKEYLATSLDKTKTLIYFIHPDAQKELYTKQGLLDTKIAKRYKLQELYTVKDKHTERMMADYIRPLGRDEFVETLHKAMTFPKWKPGIKFGVTDYYRNIFQHVSLFIEEAEVYYNLLIDKATPKQLAKYPKPEWGSKEPGGLFRVLMVVLEPYAENFIEMLGGEQKLKKIEGLDNFLSHFKEVNTKKAAKSREQEEDDSELRKPKSYVVSAASARKKHEDFSTYVAKSKSTIPSSRVPYARKSTGRLRILYDDDGNPIPVDESWIEQENEDSRDPGSDDEDSVDHVDMTEEELEIAWEEEQKRRSEIDRKIENWDETLADHEDAKYAANALYALTSAYQKSSSASFSHNRGNPRSQDPKKSGDQVCFAYAFGKCPVGDKCQYSHDKMKIEDFLAKQFNRMKTSPFWKDSILHRVLPKPPEQRSGHDTPRVNFQGSNGRPYAGRGGIHTPLRKPTYGENKLLIQEENAPPEDQSTTKHNERPGTNLPLSSERSGSTRAPSIAGDRADSDV